MHIGILYNTFVCQIAGLVSLVVFFQLRKLRKAKKAFYGKGLDYFLLSFGILWILVGLRVFFVWLSRRDLEMFLWNYFTGPLTYLHILPLAFYFGWSFFDKKIIRVFFEVFFSLTILLSVFTLIKYGSLAGELTFWGTKPIANQVTHKIFVYGVFLPIFFSILIEFIRRLLKWRASLNIIEKRLFGISFGLLIYALIGILDGLAIVKGVSLLLVRIGIMVSVLVIYFFATEQT